MADFLADTYLWVKALHIIAVISWMAGMLYLPRLFVYHVQSDVGSVQSETFKVMEAKLLRVIINPAMIATWVFGLILSVTPQTGAWSSGWFHSKFLLVIVLTSVHGYFSKLFKELDRDQRSRDQRFYRIINEVPTVLMILIVILAVVKPF